ncbi:MAG: DsrE family protein [Candidatus Freyarchaeota archaeon]|nr:DsrE family protein [Candidatus Jordarchaeia archaeon]MBS7280336.1 DsrE family protein [Candidatus Jordarchaeia archaeon]
MQRTLLILLFESPYQHDSAEHAYEIARAALRKGHKVNIFLMMDGVYNPLTSQNAENLRARAVSDKLSELISMGARVTMCRVCAEVRGVLDEMLLEGVDVGGIYDLADMVAESNVTISFIGRN